MGAAGKSNVFGDRPQVTLVLDSTGAYSMVLVDPRRPRWSSDRTKSGDSDLITAAKGIVAQYGTWEVDAQNGIFIHRIDGALNPGLAGVEQRLRASLVGDYLRRTLLAQRAVEQPSKSQEDSAQERERSTS
jgi:hypothetical protein